MEYYFLRYGDLELQRRMVSDRIRTDAFAQAIQEVVSPGDVVLDVGTGTGILAMLAARAGASRVYGIDNSEIAQTAANLVKANQLTQVVKILRGPAQELELESEVDLLVSEWLGNFGYVENMLSDVLEARDINLKPEGIMLPSEVALWMAPLDDPYLYFRDGPGFWRRPVHGLDLSALEKVELGQGRAAQIRVEPSGLLGQGRCLFALDLAEAEPEDPFGSRSLELTVERDGVLSGFVGWFDARLAPSVLLSTSPLEPETHWSQTWFPFPPHAVKEGERLDIEVEIQRDPEESRHLSVSLRLGDVHQHYTLE